jgi:hypothetical protein
MVQSDISDLGVLIIAYPWARQKNHLKIANKSYENVPKFKCLYLGTTMAIYNL